jgi:hypothetical protein
VLLDFLKLAPQAFANRLTFHYKVPVPIFPADMREAKKVECSRFSFSSLLPLFYGKSPELNQACFVRV